MGLSPRLLAAAFGIDLVVFLAWASIAVWAKYDGGAPAWQLGLLPVFSGIAYVVTSRKAGALSDRVSRMGLVRTGTILFAVFCGLAWLARSVPGIALLGALNGFAMALVWPAFHARVADDSDAGNLERNLGAFSIAWSGGKTAGFFVFSLVYGRSAAAGAEAGLGIDTLLLCAGAALLLVFVLPRPGPGRGPAAMPLVRDQEHPPALRAAFLRAGWWTNFAAYGFGATLVYLYPALLHEAGRPEADHGLVAGAVYLGQTASFWAFGRWSGWRYRFAPLLRWTVLGAAGLMVLGLGAPLPVAVAAGLVLGVSLGQAYAASVYYSVHSHEARGARAGIHEAVVGMADCGIPLLGGLVASATAWPPAAFAFSAAVAIFGLSMARRATRAAGA
jgi:MFS family permease